MNLNDELRYYSIKFQFGTNSLTEMLWPPVCTITSVIPCYLFLCDVPPRMLSAKKRLSFKIQLLTTVWRVSSPIIPNERECEKTTTVTPCTAIDSEADVALGRVRPGNVWIQASYCEGKDALCIEITSDVAPQTQDFCFHYELSMVLEIFFTNNDRMFIYIDKKREGTHPMVK